MGSCSWAVVLALLSISAQGFRVRKRQGDQVGNPTCDSQWNNQACAGQFGNEECFTCGERITWLINSRGLPEAVAKQRVADEFFQVCGACGAKSGDTDLEYEGYQEVWRDDFNYNGAVDTSQWRAVHSGGGFGNNELQHYTNRIDNAWVSDGSLKIRARKENYGRHAYTSAKLESTGNWKYGKFSCRTKFWGMARGTWAAHWMMPTDSVYGGWPHSGEIDIMEHVGYDTGKFHGTVHTGAYHHSIGTQIGGSTAVDASAWHTWTAEWRDEIILFAVDGEVYQIFRKEGEDSAKWPFDQRFYLILNYAVGGDWGGSQGIDEAAFYGEGQIFEVDWCKVEQRGWGAPPSPSPGCGSQWDNVACEWKGSTQECFTCGDRITWLRDSQGWPEDAARRQVASEFPSECGACGN